MAVIKSPVCQVTLASTPAEKRKLPRCSAYFLVKMQFTDRDGHRSHFVFYFYFFCKCRNLSYLKCYSRICHREANAILAKPGRACAKIFMFPVKPRRCLADFNAESIVSCLRQRDLTGFFCIIIKIGCCLSMRVEIRDTWVTLLSVNIVFDSCRRQNIWVCNPASRETWPSCEITGEPLNSRILVSNRRESTGVLPGALRNWSSRLLRSSTYTGLRNQR